MGNLMRVAVLSSIVLGTSLSNSRLVHAQTSDAGRGDSSEKEAALRQWLKSSGLAANFDILRIGAGPHPDPDLALEGSIQHLELRFLPTSSSQAEEIARFKQFLTTYETTHAIALPGKLFFEYIHTFGIQRQNACVDLHVMEAIYSVCSSRKDATLEVLENGTRGGLQLFQVTISAAAPNEVFKATGGQQSVFDPTPVSDVVEKFLRAYLEGRGTSKPKVIAERSDGYLGLTVEGAKGIVTDGYWEWLSIDLVFHSETAAGKGNGRQWKFACSVGVKYASSPREKRPVDADSDYPTQVANFRKELVDRLQKHLEQARHD